MSAGGLLQAAVAQVSLLSAGLSCALLFCLFGYGAFCYLAYQHSPERGAEGDRRRIKEQIKEAVQHAALTHEALAQDSVGSEREKAFAPPTPAPETPAASARGETAHARLSSDDGMGAREAIPVSPHDRLGSTGPLPPETVMVPRSLTDPANGGRLALEAPVADGEHNFVWEDGSEYFGEWASGKAHGRGVFCWPSGAPLDCLDMNLLTESFSLKPDCCCGR